MALSHPVPGGVQTDRFGPRGAVAGLGDLGFHTGNDWKAPKGTPVLAAHTGRIKSKWWDTFKGGGAAGGWMVSIIGDDGLETRYAHLHASSPLAVGQRVTAGQQIGGVGSTGAATGDHLHFEVLKGGQFIDPLTLIGEDDLSAEAERQIAAIYAAQFGPENLGVTELTWASKNGPQKSYYGHLEIDIYTQKLVAQLTGQISALTELVKTLAVTSGAVIPADFEEMVSKAVDDSLSKLVLRAE